MKVVFALYYEMDEGLLWNLSKECYGNCLFYPFRELKKRLTDAGHQVYTRKEQDIKNADIAVFYDIDKKLYELASSLPSGIKKILFCNESPIYTPFAHHIEILGSKVWDAVITYNRSFSGARIYNTDIPIAGVQVSKHYEPEAKKENDCGVIVATCKRDVRGDLFKRDSMLGKLSQKGQIHIYGGGWDTGKNIFGRIDDKLSVMYKYKFSLVIENAIYPGYVTEKLGDAILAGLPSIYYGDFENAERRFPGSFVKLENLTEECFMKSLSFLNMHYGILLKNVKACQLNSPVWADSFFDTFISVIENFEDSKK